MYDRALSVKQTVEKLIANKNQQKTQVPGTSESDNIDKKAFVIWKALMRWMQDYCEECNAGVGEKTLEFVEDEGNKFHVLCYRDYGNVTLLVEFEPNFCGISYTRDFGSALVNDADKECLRGKREQYFYSEIDGDDLWFTHQGKRVTLDEMGETLVQFLLG